MSILEFLLARIAEDEDTYTNWSRFEVRDGIPGSYSISARVLAECEAKRRIVNRECSMTRVRHGSPPYNGPLTDPFADQPTRHPDLAAYLAQYGDRVTDTPTIRDLAAVYSGHRDYESDWAP